MKILKKIKKNFLHKKRVIEEDWKTELEAKDYEIFLQKEGKKKAEFLLKDVKDFLDNSGKSIDCLDNKLQTLLNIQLSVLIPIITICAYLVYSILPLSHDKYLIVFIPPFLLSIVYILLIMWKWILPALSTKPVDVIGNEPRNIMKRSFISAEYSFMLVSTLLGYQKRIDNLRKINVQKSDNYNRSVRAFSLLPLIFIIEFIISFIFCFILPNFF